MHVHVLNSLCIAGEVLVEEQDLHVLGHVAHVHARVKLAQFVLQLQCPD